MEHPPAALKILASGADVFRNRPALFIGEDTPGTSRRTRLVEAAMAMIATDAPAPSAIRLLQWRDGELTIAFDGEPLPIAPFARAPDAVPHPELYRFFLAIGGHVTHPALAEGGCALNALCEQLAVSTVHDGDRYRASFSRGMLVTLLAMRPCPEPLGTNWLTFLPDPAVITGELTGDAARACVERTRAASPGVRFEYLDRTDASPPW